MPQNWAYSGLTAGADLTAGQYKLVKVGSNPREVVLAGAGERAIGVLYNAPNSGEAAQVVCGEVEVECGATVALGVNITPAADGQAVGLTGSEVSDGTATGVVGDVGCGFLLEAGADGTRVRAWIMPGYTLITAVAT